MFSVYFASFLFHLHLPLSRNIHPCATVFVQEMGKMWQAMDEKEKGPYEKKAEAAKKKYAEEMAAYES